MRKYILVLVSIFVGCLASQAWSIDSGGQWPDITQQGKLFTLKIVPKGQKLEVEVVGYPAAGVRWDDVSLEAYYGLGRQKRTVRVEKANNRFVLQRGEEKNLQFQLKSRDENYKENFNIELK